MPRQKLTGLSGKDLLRITCMAGFLLLIISGAGLIFFSVMGSYFRNSSGAPFAGALREYDRLFAAIVSAPDVTGTELESFDETLDMLENKAESVDSLLSVLKRRRELARRNSRYLPAYRDAARRAASVYPHSDQLAAVAAAALIRETALTREKERELRAYLPRLAGSRLEALRLGLHVLLGDLQNPGIAAVSTADFSPAYPPAYSPAFLPDSFPGRESIAVDAALLKIIRGESAAVEIQELLAGYRQDNGTAAAKPENFTSMPAARTLTLAAEYFYDFGDPMRAAELFSLIPGETALVRRADSLWHTDSPESARSLWLILAGEDIGTEAPDILPGKYRGRAMYNLAVTAATRGEAEETLQKLAAFAHSTYDTCREFGIIRYSRFLNVPNAAALLENTLAAGVPRDKERPLSSPSITALLDLEMLRRRAELWENGRVIGETWLLLGRHPNEENLYHWAAWYFTHQRAYGETALLLKNAGRFQANGGWAGNYGALTQIAGGNIDGAEQLLNAQISGEEGGWQTSANMGRIFEARAEAARALEHYEKAATEARRTEDSSRIQFCIARCYKTLGRLPESRQALENALYFNPENLNARLELSRLNSLRQF